MASYKITDKLTAGAYYSSNFNLKQALGSARYQKDWTMSGRYDLTSNIYLKAEEHIVRGTQSGFVSEDNPNLQPNTKLTILKVGVSF